MLKKQKTYFPYCYSSQAFRLSLYTGINNINICNAYTYILYRLRGDWIKLRRNVACKADKTEQGWKLRKIVIVVARNE